MDSPAIIVRCNKALRDNNLRIPERIVVSILDRREQPEIIEGLSGDVSRGLNLPIVCVHDDVLSCHIIKARP